MHVKIHGFIRYLIAIFVVAGLIAGPLSAPPAAGAMQADLLVNMSDDMPCCPDAPPSDCQKCPFVMVCLSQLLIGPPTDIVANTIAVSHSRMAIPVSDSRRDGLGYSPPPRPPRYLVPSA